jgi:two-component system response regulator DegU
METICLLIIDTNETVRQALEARLSVFPQFEVVSSGSSAAEVQCAIRQAHPDVVIIEPKHINGGGLALIQSLTMNPRPPFIIILTSYCDENEQMIAGELGIDCYLLKDIDTDTLVETILAKRLPPGGESALTAGR